MSISTETARLIKTFRVQIKAMHFPTTKGGRDVVKVLGSMVIFCAFLAGLIFILAVRG